MTAHRRHRDAELDRQVAAIGELHTKALERLANLEILQGTFDRLNEEASARIERLDKLLADVQVQFFSNGRPPELP